MKILLTGSDGFTGIEFSALAVRAGHEVIALVSDIRDYAALSDEVCKIDIDCVLHLAAISFVGHSNESEFYDVNVLGTCNLLKALAKIDKAPLKVVIASSANVYGNSTDSPITEQTEPNPVNHYAMSKLAMEYMAKTYASDLPIVIARPFNYTGAGQSKSFVIPKLVEHFVAGKDKVLLGNIDVEREFNDVQMVCEAYLQLLAYGVAGETYNICSGKPYALKSVITMLESITGHFMQVEINPAFVRPNEVVKLYGSPDKLLELVRANSSSLRTMELNDTLQTMITNSTTP